MELRNITTFLRVAELQNFTHAAQELGYSQSAVTVQIRQLEIELGVPLFERIGRSVNLTAPGQAFLQQAGEDASRPRSAPGMPFAPPRSRRAPCGSAPWNPWAPRWSGGSLPDSTGSSPGSMSSSAPPRPMACWK